MLRNCLFSMIMLFCILSSAQEDNPLVFLKTDVWNAENSSWRNNIKQSYEYDDLGRQIYFLQSLWPADGERWFKDNESFIKYEKDYTETKTYYYDLKGGYSMNLSRNKADGSGLIYEEYRYELPPNQQYWERTQWYNEMNGYKEWQIDTFDFRIKEWIPFYSIYTQGTYNTEGCLTEVIGGSNNEPRFREFYFTDESCRTIRLISQNFFSDINSWVNFRKDSFEYKEDTLIEYRFTWDHENLVWFLRSMNLHSTTEPFWSESFNYYEFGRETHSRIEYNNGDGIVSFFEEERSSSSDDWILKRTFFLEWGENGLIKSEIDKSNFLDGEWGDYREVHYFYNNKDDLLKSEIFHRWTDIEGNVSEIEQQWDYEYEYYCNDLKNQQIEYLNSIPQGRRSFGYLNAINCITDDLLQTSIYAYPNPTSGYLFIESEKLSDPDARIRIQDTKGTIISDICYSRFSKFIELNLNNLPPETYILSIILKSKDVIESKKIIKH